MPLKNNANEQIIFWDKTENIQNNKYTKYYLIKQFNYREVNKMFDSKLIYLIYIYIYFCISIIFFFVFRINSFQLIFFLYLCDIIYLRDRKF